MDNPAKREAYEITLNYETILDLHNQNNEGSNGSNRLLRRSVNLADRNNVDALSGSIAKHEHSGLVTEILEGEERPICPACRVRDSRRAAALVGHADYTDLSTERVLLGCGVCDIEGVLVTGKNASLDGSDAGRSRISKSSVIEFGWGVAKPDRFGESTQTMTRIGEGQMLMKMPLRSGEYARNVRYKAMAIGMDSYTWRQIVTDQDERNARHRAVIQALCDMVLSPDGAMTATFLPHLAGVKGIAVLKKSPGRAPLYSALADNFVETITTLAQIDGTCEVYPFANIIEFAQVMKTLKETTIPYVRKNRC